MIMEDKTKKQPHTHKKSSVAVKEVKADDAGPETICMSHSLAEILVKDPVCGPSDYSELPGVSRGVCSSWRSFAEFPRRSNTPARYQTDAPASSEQRRQKNYDAKIRREKQTLQRVAKRERLRAQQRERHRQETFLYKLQDQSSDVVNSCLETGVIISSPKKGSPKKVSPKKPSQRDHNEYTHGKKKHLKYTENSKTLHREDVPWKPHGNSKKKVNYDVNTFGQVDGDVHARKYFDDDVSTTSAHHGDVEASQSSKTSLISTVSSASQDKNSVLDFFGDREENPVSSSSQVTQQMSLEPILSDTTRPSVSTTCIVTSTTAPEIADADSSTTSIPKRKTRNVKRVNYTEMLDDEFDQDLGQKSFRESNSGRKIRPVKRTLEKAIVDASLKKSPRKRKIEVDTKGGKSGSQPHSALSSNTEIGGNKIKQIKNATKKSAANTAHVAEKPNNSVSGQKHKQSTPKSVSADAPRHSQKQSTPKPVSADEPRHSHKQCTPKSVLTDVPQHSHKQSTPKSVLTDVPQHSHKQSTPKSVLADVPRYSHKQCTPKSVLANAPRHSQKQSTLKSVAADVPQQQQKQSTPKSVSAEVPGICLPAPTTATSQSHSLCPTYASESPFPAHSAFASRSLSNRQHNPSDQFESIMAPSAPLTFQPNVFSCQQQPHSVPLAHMTTTAPSSVRSSHILENTAITTYNTFNSAMQPPFSKLVPSMNAQDTIRYPMSSSTLPQANMQIHTAHALPTGVSSFPKDTVVYDMNYSMQPPDVLLELQKSVPVPKKAVCPVSTYQPGIRHGTASSAGTLLTNTSARTSMAYTSNTQLGSGVIAEQQQEMLQTQKTMTDKSLTQFIKSKPMNNEGSPIMTNNRIYREDAEILCCKKRSQCDVETMLNSVHNNKVSGKSIGHPQKLCYAETVSSQARDNQNLKNSNSDRTLQPAQIVITPRLMSQEIPGCIPNPTEVQNQSQYATFSLASQSFSPQEHSLSSPAGLLQPSYQSLESSQIAAIGPPPPLISVSELLTSSVSVSSFGLNHDNPASLTYQNMSLTAPHTKHTMSPRGPLPSAPQSILKKSSTTNDMATQVESFIQRSIMTAKPGSASQHSVGSLQQQSMPPQSSHLALQYPDAFIVSRKVRPMQSYSGRQLEQQPRQQRQRPRQPDQLPRQQGQWPRMPALVSFIDNPHPTEGTQGGFQTNRSLMHSFTDKAEDNSIMIQQNLSSERRAATGITTGQKSQVPTSQQSKCKADKSKPNILAKHKLPPPRFTHSPGGTAVQQCSAHNHRKTTPINPKAPVSNPEVETPSDTHTLHHWRPPMEDESAQTTRSQPAGRKQSHDQMLQKTNLADCSQPHANDKCLQPGIYQQNPSYPKCYDGAKEKNAGPDMLHPFSNAEDQRALKHVSSMTQAKMLQSSSNTLPSRASGVAAQNANLMSSPQNSVQADKYVVSTSQTPPSSTANIVMYAMDLSKKSSSGGPKPIKIVITTSVAACVPSSSSVTSTVTTSSRLPLQKPVAMLFASSVKPMVTATSILSPQKPVTVLVTSPVTPSVTAASKLLQQKPVTILVTSSIASSANSSVIATSRLPQQKPVTVPVTPAVNPSVTTASRLPQQKPVTIHVTSSAYSSVTTASRFPQQKSVTIHVPSSVNPSVTTASRLPAQRLITIPVPSSVSSSVTTISRSSGQKPVTMYVTSSLNPQVTTISSLPQGHSVAMSDKAPEVACSYPITRPQIKQEMMSQHDQSEENTSQIMQPVFRKSLCHMTESTPMVVTTAASVAHYSQNSVPAREFTKVQLSQSVANSRDSSAVSVPQMALPATGNNPRSIEEHIKVKVEAHSSQNSIPARELAKGQLSQSVANSRDSSTVSVPQMTLPAMGNNPRSVEEHVKVEAHLSHDDSSEQLSSSPSAQSVASSMPLSQPYLFTRAPQIPPVSASATSDTAEPQLPNQLGTSGPSLAQRQAHETATSHAVKGGSSHVDGQHSVPSHQTMVLKDALPAHIRIKQEMHADTIENMACVSSSNMPSTSHSLMQATIASAAQNNKAPDIVVNKSIVSSSNSLPASTAFSRASLLPKQSAQSTTSTVGTVAGNICKNHFTSTQSTLSSHTFEHSPDSQPMIPRVASHTQHMNNPLNSTYGRCKHSALPNPDPPSYTSVKVEQSGFVDSSSSQCITSESSLANSSKGLAAVSQTAVPACSSATISEAAFSMAGQMLPPSFTQMVNYSCDKYTSEEPVKTQIAVELPQLPSATSPNKHPIIGVSPSRQDSILNDPLFAWHTDSNKQVSSFSLEDITNSLPLEYEQNVPGLLSDISMANMYTVTVSYPDSDNSNLLRCDGETSSVDMNIVKVEPTVEPVLNLRGVIDLCLSDSEENDRIDTKASSCLQREDSVDSISQLTYASKPKDPLENVKATASVNDSKDKHLSKDSHLQTNVSVTSDHHDAMSTPEKSVSGISKLAMKQIIKSPLTGHNVSVSGEHMTFIRRRLARISTDLMSITSDIPESETPLVSTDITDRVLCDSETLVCELEDLPWNASSAETELHPAITQTPEGKKRFNTLEVNTKRASAARKQTCVEVKKEYIETISIDDDSDDEDSQQTSTTSEAHFSRDCSPSGSIFSLPFGASSPGLSPQKDRSLLSSSESSMMTSTHSGAGRLASIASWTNEEVAEWLKNHKLDRVCPNLKSLDGRGLQRMAFEHHRDPDLFYKRVKKTLGLTFFQTMVICHSMKELNDSGLDDC